MKEALRRDWEQTKADFTNNRGQELDHHVDDTVKQALGKQAIPPRHVPNSDWDEVEPGLRYGWGAAGQYSEHRDWDDRVESKLRRKALGDAV